MNESINYGIAIGIVIVFVGFFLATILDRVSPQEKYSLMEYGCQDMLDSIIYGKPLVKIDYRLAGDSYYTLTEIDLAFRYSGCVAVDANNELIDL